MHEQTLLPKIIYTCHRHAGDNSDVHSMGSIRTQRDVYHFKTSLMIKLSDKLQVK